jgi:hypothetical protein
LAILVLPRSELDLSRRGAADGALPKDLHVALAFKPFNAPPPPAGSSSGGRSSSGTASSGAGSAAAALSCSSSSSSGAGGGAGGGNAGSLDGAGSASLESPRFYVKRADGSLAALTGLKPDRSQPVQYRRASSMRPTQAPPPHGNHHHHHCTRPAEPDGAGAFAAGAVVAPHFYVKRGDGSLAERGTPSLPDPLGADGFVMPHVPKAALQLRSSKQAAAPKAALPDARALMAAAASQAARWVEGGARVGDARDAKVADDDDYKDDEEPRRVAASPKALPPSLALRPPPAPADDDDHAKFASWEPSFSHFGSGANSDGAGNGAGTAGAAGASPLWRSGTPKKAASWLEQASLGASAGAFAFGGLFVGGAVQTHPEETNLSSRGEGGEDDGDSNDSLGINSAMQAAVGGVGLSLRGLSSGFGAFLSAPTAVRIARSASDVASDSSPEDENGIAASQSPEPKRMGSPI